VSVRERVRRLAAPVGRPVRRAVVARRTRNWRPHSRLFIGQEAAEWVLSYEARQLVRTARTLGVELGPPEWVNAIGGQSIFHQSQFTLLLHDFERRGNNLGVAYFHGRPGTPGMPEFDACFDTMRRRHAEIDRVQVTNREMEGLVLETGMAAEKVHRIPIGIDVEAFPLRSPENVRTARHAFDLPESAFVVGSFQKDGVGWGDGLEPKLIKGPDVLVDVASRLHDEVADLVVLLTGPSRGYVKAGLDRARVPYRHVLLPDVDAVARAYEAIDVCLVASRDEGGPRAVLESMATGVPLVTTCVGQAADIVENAANGWMVAVEDAEALTAAVVHVAEAPVDELERVRFAGRVTAEDNSYPALRPRWRALLDGFVAIQEED
jgi:glycosyltransferase involved in cell wall biosynthesis